MGWLDKLSGWWQGRQPPAASAAPRIIVASDVHLGEEVGEGDAPFVEYIRALNDSFGSFVDALVGDAREPITLVLNGDWMDFLRTLVQPNPMEARVHGTRPLTPREARMGLDSSREHAVWKLGHIIAFHRPVFQALARFVAAGHQLVVIRGNHDVEMYWPEVRETVIATLAELGERPVDEVARRVRFEPWFLLVPGRLYVEHGHQYDPHCSYEDLLDPVEDEGRSLALPYVSWSIRYFAPLLHGAPAAEMEDWSFFDFFRFAARQPPQRFITAVMAYARLAVDVLARKSWRHTVGRARIRARHLRRLAAVAERSGLPVHLVARLDALKETPVAERFLGILLAFYLDRFLLLALTGVSLLAAVLLPLGVATRAALGVGVLGLAVVAHEVLRRLRALEAAPHLVEKAHLIARLLGVPFVSFGHSHEAGVHPEATPADRPPTRFYLNSGHWVARYARSACTYVEVGGPAGAPLARLLRWNGPGVEPTELGRATPGREPSLRGRAVLDRATEESERGTDP